MVDEISKGCGGFVRSQGDARVCYEARKETCHFMTMSVNASVEVCRLIVEFEQALIRDLLKAHAPTIKEMIPSLIDGGD